MEPAIISILALMLTVMLYLDRGRRNDTRDLRAETNTQFTALRKEIIDGNAALRAEMAAGFARTDARIDQLTTAVIALAESLGQVKGRTEVLVAAE